MRDPYAVYASAILRLRKLDDLNEALAPRHIGNFAHAILRQFVADKSPLSDSESVPRLMSLFDEQAPKFGLTPSHKLFWREPMRKAFENFVGWDQARRRLGRPCILEDAGVCEFDIDGRTFDLAARADRIDLLEDGALAIIDYKTGRPPSLRQTQSMFSPQLPLTGVIAQKGGFQELGPRSVGGLEYYRFSAKEQSLAADEAQSAELIAVAERGFIHLMRHFNNAVAPYPSQPRPEYCDDYGDFDHLARRRERNTHGGGE